MKANYLYPIKYFRSAALTTCAAAILNACGGEEKPKDRDPYSEPRVTISESVITGNQVFVGSFVGDVNNDGFEDVIAIGLRDEFIVLINDKDGRLIPLNGSASTLKGVYSLVDLNQDGNLDLLMLSDGNWSTASGNGDGTFNDPQSYSEVLSDSYTGVAFGDFDGNGNLDLVAVSHQGATLLIADGEDGYTSSPLSNSAYAVHVEDFNVDGVQDILVVGPYRLSLYAGNGDGTFRLPQITETEIQFSGGTTEEIYFRDLNGDGWLDIASMQSSGLSVHLYSHENGFTEDFYLSHHNGAGYNVDTFYLNSFTVADMNCDGAGDLVLAEFVSGTVKVLSSNADGTFRKAIELDPNKMLRRVDALDVNRDGALDLFALPGGEVYTNLSCLP